MELNNSQEAFFALLRAGLWEKEARILEFGEVDYEEVMRLAEEQSVIGLIAAGMEHVSDTRIPKPDLLQAVGHTLQIEDRNRAMNHFVGVLTTQLRNEGISSVLVKGQGIAQCYERPLWRLSGDVDILVDIKEYEKAKYYIYSILSDNKHEERYSKHIGMTIGDWYVELHGSLRTGLSSKIDKVVDDVQSEIFRKNNIRVWSNDGVDVLLPSANNDVFLVYSHFIKHFYKGGVTLRQVCDWCRILWKNNDEIDPSVLENWLKESALLTEWKAFAAVAVNYLGMPVDVMPLYDVNSVWERKAEEMIRLLINGYSGNKVKDTIRIARLFPLSTFSFLPGILLNVNMLKIKERIVGM